MLEKLIAVLLSFVSAFTVDTPHFCREKKSVNKARLVCLNRSAPSRELQEEYATFGDTSPFLEGTLGTARVQYARCKSNLHFCGHYIEEPRGKSEPDSRCIRACIRRNNLGLLQFKNLQVVL